MTGERTEVRGSRLADWLRRLFAFARGRRGEAGAFRGSGEYWEQRYATGGNSGAGSYERYAEFKAEVLNGFVARENIASVIEFGCGDGNQLALAEYPRYHGFDVSDTVLAQCRERFASQDDYQFSRMADYAGESAELALSLDVIYHLVEDKVYESYMRTLFGAGERFVIVYSSNREGDGPLQSPHVRHRRFTDWVEANAPGWQQIEHIPNRYPPRGFGGGSFADFYIFAREAGR